PPDGDTDQRPPFEHPPDRHRRDRQPPRRFPDRHGHRRGFYSVPLPVLVPRGGRTITAPVRLARGPPVPRAGQRGTSRVPHFIRRFPGLPRTLNFSSSVPPSGTVSGACPVSPYALATRPTLDLPTRHSLATWR